MDAGTPALTGGAAAPPPKKRRTDAADSAAQPAADGTQTKPHQGPTAAAEPTAGGGSGGAKETKNQKKRRGIRSNSSSSGSGKTFIFGNYDAYYRYRGAASADPSQSGDPRLQLLQRSWFEGRSVLDIGCNSGVITFAMAEQFAPSSILGVDIDGHLISRAQGRLARLRQAAVMTASAQAAGAAAAAAAAGGGSASAADGSTAAAPATESAPTGYPYNLEFRAENFVAKKHRQKQKKAAAKAAAAQAAPAAVGTAAAKPSGGGGGGPVKPVYGVILCLSVTKWIHLNWGDAGIKTLFRRVWESLPTDGTGVFILEPQPWASYKKKYCLTPTTKAHFQAIQIRPEDFTTFLTQTMGFELLETLLPTLGSCASKGFKRPLHVYRRPPDPDPTA